MIIKKKNIFEKSVKDALLDVFAVYNIYGNWEGGMRPQL